MVCNISENELIGDCSLSIMPRKSKLRVLKISSISTNK